jgi:acyl-CoA thioester hydrolase
LNSSTDIKSGAGFCWRLRVYYEDTDAAGVVYYANYLKFLERARTEWLRSAGFEQTVLRDEYGIVFVVRALAIEYMVPARFDDALEITVLPCVARGSVLELAQSVCRDGNVLATATVKVVCVNTPSFRPVRIPSTILEKLAAGCA